MVPGAAREHVAQVQRRSARQSDLLRERLVAVERDAHGAIAGREALRPEAAVRSGVRAQGLRVGERRLRVGVERAAQQHRILDQRHLDLARAAGDQRGLGLPRAAVARVHRDVQLAGREVAQLEAVAGELQRLASGRRGERLDGRAGGGHAATQRRRGQQLHQRVGLLRRHGRAALAAAVQRLERERIGKVRARPPRLEAAGLVGEAVEREVAGAVTRAWTEGVPSGSSTLPPKPAEGSAASGRESCWTVRPAWITTNSRAAWGAGSAHRGPSRLHPRSGTLPPPVARPQARTRASRPRSRSAGRA